MTDNNSKPTQDDFIDLGSRMSQELQEFVDEAAAAGSENPLPGVTDLINEWDALVQRADPWQTAVAENSGPSRIAALDGTDY